MLQKLREFKIVPVVTYLPASKAEKLGQTLIAGGLPVVEMTLRDPEAMASLAILTQIAGLTVGAGTVINAKQADAVVKVGVDFIVSPGFDLQVARICDAACVLYLPGVATPTEVQRVLCHGLKAMKFFPAEALGGVSYLKAIGAPYGDVCFMPTGGINPRNVNDYLTLPNVLACGGSWLTPRQAIEQNQWSEILQRVQDAVSLK